MAIFAIIKFIGFLKVGVLKTIIAMREFPINETTSIKLKATVCTRIHKDVTRLFIFNLSQSKPPFFIIIQTKQFLEPKFSTTTFVQTVVYA